MHLVVEHAFRVVAALAAVAAALNLAPRRPLLVRSQHPVEGAPRALAPTRSEKCPPSHKSISSKPHRTRSNPSRQPSAHSLPLSRGVTSSGQRLVHGFDDSHLCHQ